MNLLLKQHYKTVSVEMSELSVQTRLNESNKQLQEKHLGNIEEISSKRIKGLTTEKEGYQNDLAKKQFEVDNLQEKIHNLVQAEADHDKLASLKIMLESRKTNTEKKIKFFNEKDNCDVCEQPIESSFKQTRVQDLQEKVVEFDGGLDKMKIELDSLHSNIQEMSGHSRTINGLNTEIKSITGLLERCQNDLDTLNEEKDKTDTIKKKLQNLKLR